MIFHDAPANERVMLSRVYQMLNEHLHPDAATLHHAGKYGQQSAATITTYCDIECSTWDRPLRYAWEGDYATVTCPACLRALVIELSAQASRMTENYLAEREKRITAENLLESAPDAPMFQAHGTPVTAFGFDDASRAKRFGKP